jgi:hypothetical protein
LRERFAAAIISAAQATCAKQILTFTPKRRRQAFCQTTLSC